MRPSIRLDPKVKYDWKAPSGRLLQFNTNETLKLKILAAELFQPNKTDSQ